MSSPEGGWFLWTPANIEAGFTYLARVKLRLGSEWQARPGAEFYDGATLKFKALLPINSVSFSQYRGEWAMMPLDDAHENLGPLGWLPSGDLEFLEATYTLKSLLGGPYEPDKAGT